jgi:hypothetical protein
MATNVAVSEQERQVRLLFIHVCSVSNGGCAPSLAASRRWGLDGTWEEQDTNGVRPA